MILLVLLLLLEFVISTNDFILVGFSVDFGYFYDPQISCDYFTTCPLLICNTLKNNTLIAQGLAFVALNKISNKELSCKSSPFSSNSSMISFILDYETKFKTPIACNNIADCLTKSCILFNNDKNNLGIGFMGQCF